MNLNSMVDMFLPSPSSSSNTSSSSSSSSKDGNSNFENLLKDKAQTSKDKVDQKDDVSTPNTGATSDDTSDSTEVTDTQRELMAALHAQVVQIRPIELVDQVDGELLTDGAVLVVDEGAMLNQTDLDMGDPTADLVQQLDTTLGTEIVEEVVTEGAFSLEDLDLNKKVDPELDLDVPVVEEEIVIEEKAVEVETEIPEEVEAVKTETVDVDSSDDDAPEAKTEVVEGQGTSTKVFEKVEATPIKVAETVNTEDPDMDSVMAKIIHQADENGDKTVTIMLTPESLGTVTIQLTKTTDGILQVVMQAADEAAAKLLSKHADSIAAALNTNGSTVMVEVNAQEVQDNHEEANPDQHSQKNEQQREEEQEEELGYGEDFLQQLRLGLVEFNT